MSGLASMLTHVNPFRVIPKSSLGKWRLITNLSAPLYGSVNDGISKELSSLSYIRVDLVAEQVVWLGRGALLAKLDIQSAYRIVPVHPDDRRLLKTKRKRQVFVDCPLSFSLRRACKIFTALADAVEWVTSQVGAQGIAHPSQYHFPQGKMCRHLWYCFEISMFPYRKLRRATESTVKSVDEVRAAKHTLD